jgi:hypothetical protein
MKRAMTGGRPGILFWRTPVPAIHALKGYSMEWKIIIPSVLTLITIRVGILLPMKVFEDPSCELAHACWGLVPRSWNVDLPNLRAGGSQMAFRF